MLPLVPKTPSQLDASLQSPADLDIPEDQLTTAERTRRDKLCKDPMALLVNQLFVDCRRCSQRIKLSPKSRYDPFHWKTHKGRCNKRRAKLEASSARPAKPWQPRGSPAAPRATTGLSTTNTTTSERVLRFKAYTPPTPQLMDPAYSPKPAPSSLASRSRSQTRSSPTPPLTPDSSGSEDTTPMEESRSPSPDPPPPVRVPSIYYAQPEGGYHGLATDYLARSQRRVFRKAGHDITLSDNWRDWSFSQLKPPIFPFDPHPHA